MPSAALDRVRIKGFTSIVDAEVELGPLNVLVGANGAGKSNFVKALELLGRIVDEDLRTYIARSGGAYALLSSGVDEMTLAVSGDWGDREAGYVANLVPDADAGLIFAAESIWIQRPEFDRPWEQTIDRGHRETRLHRKAESSEQGSGVSAEVVELLRGCRVYHFHDTSPSAPVHRPSSTADNLSLHPDASNLAAVLLALRESVDDADVAAYRRIVGAVSQVAPFFREFVLAPEGGRETLRLRWRERGADAVWGSSQMSDGTLRFVCLATLLLQPQPPAVVVLDEPELGLHPYAIVQLAGLLRSASVHSQVVIATQSVTLMNQFALDDLIVVERGEVGTTFERPDAAQLGAWLAEYSLGELWEKNLIGGRPAGALALSSPSRAGGGPDRGDARSRALRAGVLGDGLRDYVLDHHDEEDGERARSQGWDR